MVHDPRSRAPSVAPLADYLDRIEVQAKAVAHYAGERRLAGYLASMAAARGNAGECEAWQISRATNDGRLTHHLNVIKALLHELHDLASQLERQQQ